MRCKQFDDGIKGQFFSRILQDNGSKLIIAGIRLEHKNKIRIWERQQGILGELGFNFLEGSLTFWGPGDMLLLLSLSSERGECVRTHFNVVTIIVDHANKLAELSRVRWRRKAKDGINFLRLRLNSIRCNDMTKVFYFLDCKETFLWLNGKIRAVQASGQGKF